ncbi:hypothetical protein [Nodularia sp. UHCC 0506]|uniref:hypothetical protein n=1 Tax=Nodularia sp. UHCC 0506 TaxID=3110243 RepID=UPI002B20B5AF|nr:hypothetical protein [Nodularia sp. UHCC 0506]MEA5516560.1 hypothetical protein [Nodularia sp. UHCC 0506]
MGEAKRRKSQDPNYGKKRDNQQGILSASILNLALRNITPGAVVYQDYADGCSIEFSPLEKLSLALRQWIRGEGADFANYRYIVLHTFDGTSFFSISVEEIKQVLMSQ